MESLPRPTCSWAFSMPTSMSTHKSFPEYERALELNPNLPDAHYRLGQYYVHAGQKDRAQQEFDVFSSSRRSIWPKSIRKEPKSSNLCIRRKPAPATKP